MCLVLSRVLTAGMELDGAVGSGGASPRLPVTDPFLAAWPAGFCSSRGSRVRHGSSRAASFPVPVLCAWAHDQDPEGEVSGQLFLVLLGDLPCDVTIFLPRAPPSPGAGRTSACSPLAVTSTPFLPLPGQVAPTEWFHLVIENHSSAERCHFDF